jgi:ribosomal protein S18 acetylase RimI-like enzyme
MHVTSLGYRSDLAIRRLAGSRITDRGSHIVVRTPDNPGFYWGNFALFPAAPAPGELAGWVQIFAAEFPHARHVALGIDSTDGRLDIGDEPARLGLTEDISTVLSADRLHECAHPNRAAMYRPLTSDDDWQQAVALRTALYGTSPAEVEFIARSLAEARALMATNQAEYLGAFLDGRLAAQLGVVLDGDGLARYQNVETAVEDRGRGLAGTLVVEAGTRALARPDVRELVIVADPDDVAIRVYRSVGFRAVEQQIQLQRAPS